MFPQVILKSSASNILMLVILTTEFAQATVERDSTVSETDSSLFSYQDRGYPTDCEEVQDQCSTWNTTGAHLILPHGYHEPFWVFCSGEWTRRSVGVIEFNRTWADNRDGFGYINVDHWLGNEKLSHLTNQKAYELRIDLETDSGSKGFIAYSGFRINDEFSGYSLVSLGKRKHIDESVRIQCPANMVYGNCSRCIATCADPSGTEDCSYDCSDFPQNCVCPVNYLLEVNNCVPEEQCGCHIRGYGVVADGRTHVMSNCSECTPSNCVLTCDLSPCAMEATCGEVGGIRGCFCNDGYRGDGRACTRGLSRDCSELSSSSASGNYTTTSGWILNCDMTIDGGGWTVIQRNFVNSPRQDFHQVWDVYKEGFGSPSEEFWIGNDKLFTLTNQPDIEYELRVDMVQRGTHRQFYAKYDSFSISGESDKYKLIGLGTFTSDTGYDAMRYHHNMYFTTRDRDNDRYSYNCASYYYYYGGWWYNNCDFFNTNYGYDYCSDCVGRWWNLPGDYYLIYTEMKIRPRVATY